MPDALTHFAQEITLAEIAAGQADAAHTDAQNQCAKVAQRLDALVGERAAIVTRRAGGDHRPDDGATLELIRADLEGLAPLKVAADDALATASTGHREANLALTEAKAAFAAEEGRLALGALDAHADHLLSLLTETLRQRASAAASLPLPQQNLPAVVARLGRVAEAMCLEFSAVRRSAPFRELPYTQHPVWVPSDALYREIWRLHGSAGRFN